jgi:Site-specific recombinase XerD
MATRLLEQYKWTKDGRKWVFYTYITTLNGKRKKYTSPAYHTEKEAINAEKEFADSFKPFSSENIITFKDLYNVFYDYQEDKVKPTTMKTYKDRIKYMGIFDNIKLKDLNATHYELWKKEMNKLTLSTKYKTDIQKFIKAVLNFGTKMYGYNFTNFYNKMTRFTNFYEIKKEMDFYTLDEFKLFISVETDIKYKCLFETLYFCGLRKGEARGLTWNDINFEDKELRVNKNVVNIKGENDKHYAIMTPKTASSIRVIPIPDTLLNDLKILLENDKKIYGFNNNWYLFGSIDPITNYSLRAHKNRLCDKVSLRQIRTHDFRHSCASLLINNGANITIVAKYLGHTKIDETLNTYSHMFKNKLNDIVNTINKLA